MCQKVSIFSGGFRIAVCLSTKKGSPRFKQSNEFGGFGPHMMKPRFYQTKTDPNDSQELSNLLFNHLSRIDAPKSDQKSHQKKDQIVDSKWHPKATFKISKISPSLQNWCLEHFSRVPLAAFSSERVFKSSPRTSRTSKIIVLLR